MAQTTVLYPKGTNFKMDYYLSTHMPLVDKHLSQYGLKSWTVLEFPPDSDFMVQATLEWGSEAEFQKASSSEEMKEVLDDVKNFADKQPTFLPGAVKGKK